MNLTRVLFALLFVALWSTCCLGDGPLTAAAIRLLPTSSPRGFAPRLEMHWPEKKPERLELHAKFSSRDYVVAFNPFGSSRLGCPYYIVITDTEGNPIGQINKVLPANDAIPGANAWCAVGHRVVFGRVFTRHRDLSVVQDQTDTADPFRNLDLLAIQDDEEPIPAPVVLREGEYALYLMATKRMESECLFSHEKGIAEFQKRWLTNELDKVVCRSPALRIRVGQDGRVLKPADASAESERPILVTTQVVDSRLKIEATKVAKTRHYSKDPGLAAYNNLGIDVRDPLGLDLHVRTGSSMILPKGMGPIYVPQGAIVGYLHECRLLVAGKFKVSVRFQKDLWIDEAMNAEEAETAVDIEVTEEQIRAKGGD